MLLVLPHVNAASSAATTRKRKVKIMADDKHKHACHQKHLLNYQDVIIYPSDLALLDSSTAWLNDACINFQMTRLQERKKDSRAEKRVKEVKSAAEETVDVGGIDQLDDLFIDP